MGGVSSGEMTVGPVAGRLALRMRGEVSLANNGGFIQMSLDLATDGGAVDASVWGGIELAICGNGETYGLHLRTLDVARPWQSYRHGFKAERHWQTVRLPFDRFTPHRTDVPLDVHRLRRLGLAVAGAAAFVGLFLIRGRNNDLPSHVRTVPVW
ncbi:MAG: CIA30 family protein [Rhodospirillales bacterium]|nr:CIA30 family protein [Rhodospirillales bacterium]